MKEDTIKQYLEKLSTELKLKKSSDKTISIYSYFITRFLQEVDKKPEDISEDDVKKFLANIIDSYKTKSYALVLSSLRFFFKKVVKNPVMMEIDTPKVEKEEKDVLTKDEVEKLIIAAPTQKSKLIVCFLYSTGLRISELVSLKKNDLDLVNNQGIVKRGKGKKDRKLFFSKELIIPIKKYLEGIDGELIFPGWEGKQMVPRNVQNLLNRLRNKVGITKIVSPHVLRRSYATHLHEAGVDIRFIQVLLGHSRIETTKDYVDVSKKSLEKIKNPLDSLNIKI